MVDEELKNWNASANPIHKSGRYLSQPKSRRIGRTSPQNHKFKWDSIQNKRIAPTPTRTYLGFPGCCFSIPCFSAFLPTSPLPKWDSVPRRLPTQLAAVPLLGRLKLDLAP